MKAIWQIGAREFLGYFRTPLGYVVIAAFLFAAVGLPWFVGRFFAGNDANLASFFGYLPWVFALFIPAVGMRLWAEEKKTGTWEMLLTLPITALQTVLGKFFAGWAFVLVALAGTFPLAATAFYLGRPDAGALVAGYVMAALMAGAYLSLCSMMSALTKSQVVAFVLGSLACLILVFLGWSVFRTLLDGLPVALVDAVSNFSFMTRFEAARRGLLRLEDAFFFGSILFFCLGANAVIVAR